MVVVTGIKTVIKLAPVIYRAGQIIYKAGSKTRAFDRYMARHPKALKYGTAAVGIGTLVYDLTNIDYDSLIGTPQTNRPYRKARTNLQPFGSRQFSKTDYRPGCWDRYGRQKRQQRSSHR